MKKFSGLTLLILPLLSLSTSYSAQANNDRLLWSFDNSSATQTINDESGNNQPGTLSAEPVYVTRNAQAPDGSALVASQALSFMVGGQVSSQTITASINRMTFNESFSISFWLKTTSGEQTLISKYRGNTGFTLSIDADQQLRLTLSDQGVNETLTAPFSDFFNQWTHMAIVVFREGVYWYANGVLQDFPSVKDFDMSLDADTALVIGDDEFNIRGAIDELQLFNRHITATEVNCLAADGFECVRPISLTVGQQGNDGRSVTQVTLLQDAEALKIDYNNPAKIPGLPLSETLTDIKGDPGVKGRDGQSIVNVLKDVDEENHKLSVTLQLGYFNNQCMGSRDSDGKCENLCQQTYCVNQEVQLGNLHGGVELEQPGENHKGVGIADIKMGIPGGDGTCNVSGADLPSKTHLCYKLSNSDNYQLLSAERFRGQDPEPTQCVMEQGLAGQYNIHFKTDANNNVLVETRAGNQVVGVYRRDRNGNVSAAPLVDIPYEDIKGVIGNITTVAAFDCNVSGNNGNHGTEIASWRGGSIDSNGNLILKKRLANGNESEFTAIHPRDDGSDGHGFEHFYYQKVGNVPSSQTIHYPARFSHSAKECKVFIGVPAEYEKSNPFSYPSRLEEVNGEQVKSIVLNYNGDVRNMRYVLACAMQ